MPRIEIYTRAYCPYCARARHLLNLRGLAFEEIAIDADPNATLVIAELTSSGEDAGERLTVSP